jgi:hypothetical protein
MKKILLYIILFVGFSASAQVSTIYTYDSIDRVTSVQYNNGTTIVYFYDAVGNRTSAVYTAANCPGPIETLKYGVVARCPLLQTMYE